MGDLNDIGKLAVKTIETEAHAIQKMASYINKDFELVVQLIYKNKGRVIVSGIGKSAIIANKIVATFNSTGTPAVFMHAADAIHGDLGIIQPDDVVICLSKSGNTAEIKLLAPLIRNLGNKLIAIVSNQESYLAQHADYVLRATVDAEACPNNLAPTTSTTAQLVMGDALAICLLQLRGFTEQDFARVHPGGSLGKKLYLRVEDLIDKNRKPQVSPEETIDNTIITISSHRLGATAVVDNAGAIVGIITDGDVRRMLEKTKRLDALTAVDIMSKNPKVIDVSALAVKAFNLMEKNKITQLLAVRKKEYVGMVHLHDILREGIV
ncbi:MAG: KpsF/GutQ family sugar-phosphate isomerase [Prevotellaceae bacterium]|jgi:arabinose-5-phosphate isomerase|nr:KpsF/GutQ family sugar-phosphate isomerase [Prevotellaceae bacterium]